MPKHRRGGAATADHELRNSFSLRTATAAGGLVATLLTTVVSVRGLDSREAAVFLAILAGLMLGPMFGKLGLGQNVIRLVAAHSQGSRRREVIGAHLRAAAILGVISAPIVALASTSSMIGMPIHGEVLALTAVLLVAETLRLMLSDVFAAVGDVRASVATTHHVRSMVVLPALVTIVVVVPRPTLVLVLIAYTGVALLLLSAAFVRALPLFSLRRSAAAGPMSKVVVAGLAIFVLDASVFVVGRSDVWLAAAAFDPLAATRYSTVSILAYQVTVLYGLAALAVMPVAARMLASRGEAAVRQMLSAAATLTTAVTAALVACLLIAGRPLLAFAYGPGFADGYPLLVVLAVGGLGQAVFGFSVPLLLVRGQIRRAATTSTAVLAVTVPTTVCAAFLGGPTALAAANAGAAFLLPAAQWLAAGGFRGGAPVPSLNALHALGTLRHAGGHPTVTGAGR